MIGIDPRHRRDHLSLLPSGSDEVHGLLLRGDRSELTHPACTAGRDIYKGLLFFFQVQSGVADLFGEMNLLFEQNKFLG